MSQRTLRDASVKLTHVPTGLSVRLPLEGYGHHRGDLEATTARARRLLASKLSASPAPPIRRTYTLDPGRAAGIRQDGQTLVGGIMGVERALRDGDCPWMETRP